ncbi:MAG: endonuclease [Candidatus Edwardsbacteria bacterium]|nr:endonuclease [Candidatus Edwardsbacteria bacterium]
MKKATLFLMVAMMSAPELFAGTVPPDSTIFAGQTGSQLISSLVAAYKSTSNLGYDRGRDTMYGVIDKKNDSLECVYSSYKIYMQPGQDPSSWAYDHDFNCEHSWPQSMLNSNTAVADLHHLYPTDIEVNGARDNDPFSDIPDAQTVTWYYNNTETSSIPSSNIDLYAEEASGTFEPREIQKGNTARSLYYMLTMWQLGDTDLAWWTGQKNTLYAWHANDPADAAEIARTRKIATYQQGKVNPYVLDSTLIRRAFFPSMPTSTTVNFASTSVTKSEGDGTAILVVSIANPSGSAATTVDVVLTGGTGTAADIGNYVTRTLTFPAGSTASRNDTVTITDDAGEEGTETLVLRLRNVTGGSSAAAGSDSVLTLTLTDNDDATAPSITAGPAATGITSSSATITWTTNEISNSWVYYGLTTAYSDTFMNENDVTGHSIGLSELTGSTTYHYKVSSTDPMDNGPTYSGDNTFTTAAAGSFTVVINEVNEQRSSLPLYTNEYVELYNCTGGSISLNGWQLRQDGAAYVTTFGTGDAIPAGGYFVVARTSTGNWSNFYGIPYNVVGSLTMNGGETFSLHDGGGVLVDSTITFASSYWCQYRTQPLELGTLPASWVGDAANGTSATYGTPGGANPLGVEMSSFSCGLDGGAVRLTWRTESESDSYRWAVSRAEADTGPYREIGRLDAAGNSAAPRCYAWSDGDIQPGHTYYYRLAELDLSGEVAHYGPVSVTVPAGTARVLASAAHPNPFRERTTISYQLAAPGRVTLRIYNAAGQLVRTLGDAVGQRGTNRAEWNGRDDGGRALAAGVYICRLTTAAGTARHKLLLVR